MKDDDKSDFEQFMAARWQPLVRTAYVLTGNQQDAEDIAQTALTNAYSVWPRIRKADDVTIYVHKILINAYRTTRRRRRVLEVLTSAVPERHGAAAAAATDSLHDRDEVARALAVLAPRQRAVIVLRYLEDLTEAQTASVLGCSVGTVKSQTSKALAKLRTHHMPAPAAPNSLSSQSSPKIPAPPTAPTAPPRSNSEPREQVAR